MLNALVRFSIAHRAVVLVLAAALAAFGAFRLTTAGLDIFPEFAPQLVIVQTEAPALTSEQVEIEVTQPLERALAGLIGLDHIRSESIAGLSIITAVFVEDSDTYRNRAQVAERLASAAARLPASAREPVIAPLASSSATVRTLGIVARGLEPSALRDVAERMLVPRLLGVPGVADVNVFGGAERALVVEPDHEALARSGVGPLDLERAVRGAVTRRALGAIENSNQQIAIAAHAGRDEVRAIARAVVRGAGPSVLTVDDVASVEWGALPRISAAQIGGEPAVVMMVIGQFGANTLSVSRALDRALVELEPALATLGVSLHARLFEPANYITTAVGDISRHLLIGGALVILVLLLGLYDVRTMVISALAIPLSLLTACLVLIEAGINLNVLVIGGLAIALGEVVDDAIIDTENIHRRLRLAPAGSDVAAIALGASLEVRSAVVYATFIVALVFVPLLTLGGVSGRLFAPLGLAYILAVLASLSVAITVTPALCVWLLAGRLHRKQGAPVFRALEPHYALAVRALARRPVIAILLSCASALAVAMTVPAFKARFLPELREGHFIVHTTGLPGTSLDESIRAGTAMSTAFLAIDGVRSVSQWAGRAERGADTYGSHYSEYEVALAALDGHAQQRVLEDLRATLARFPGLTFEANTFLIERIDETISGYTAPVVVNLFGDDLAALDALAHELATRMRRLPAARDVHVRAAHAIPLVRIVLDDARLARYGLAAQGVWRSVQSAYAGQVLGAVEQGGRLVPITILLSEATRADATRIGDIVIAARGTQAIRIADVAEVVQDSGRYNILHRNGQRLQVVTAHVAGADLERFTRALRAEVSAALRRAPGVHAEITGAAAEQAAARQELFAHALAAGLGVVVLIALAVRHARHVALILLNLPFSLVGGVVAVALSGGVVSIGSVVGFVTLFGITVRNSIMLVSHYAHLIEREGAAWTLDTVVRGAAERLPAIAMTALVTALAMLPLTVDSDNPGREIMGPMAAIIVGGLVSSTLLNLLVMPSLLYRFGRFVKN